MLSSMICKLVTLVIFAVAACGTALLYWRSKKIVRSELLKRIKTINPLRVWAFIFAVVIGAVFGFANHAQMKASASAVFSLSYAEASQAQNTNGTRYNMTEIICDDVLERTIKLGALENVTVSDLGQTLSVYPLVQGNSSDPTGYHISTEFVVQYSASKKTKHLNSKNLIKLLANAYKEYYIENYADGFSSEDVGNADFSGLEYMDAVQYLSNEAEKVENYMYGLNTDSKSFVGQNGITFQAVAAKAYQLRQVQIIENLRGYILQNGIAKNSGVYIERLQYENEQDTFDRDKNDASYNVCNAAIQKYAEEMTRVVLVPTWDTEGEYYMGRTKVGIDQMSVEAMNYSNMVAETDKTIETKNNIIEKMQAVNNYQIDEYTDSLIESINTEIKKLADEASALGREYSSYRMNQCISISESGSSAKDEMKSIIIMTIMAYIAAIIFTEASKMPKQGKKKQ